MSDLVMCNAILTLAAFMISYCGLMYASAVKERSNAWTLFFNVFFTFMLIFTAKPAGALILIPLVVALVSHTAALVKSPYAFAIDLANLFITTALYFISSPTEGVVKMLGMPDWVNTLFGVIFAVTFSIVTTDTRKTIEKI